MRVVFMGTPEFAVPSLAALMESGHEMAGVFTQPDRPAGRGNRMNVPPVKQLAERFALPVYQFERVRRPEGIEAMRALRPDLIVTAAFGQLLPQALLEIPALGTVNVHASLLPRHRGAAPVNWSIIHGDLWTGVTTMLTDAGMDTGATLLRKKCRIRPEETAGELTERLSRLGAALLTETIGALLRGACKPVPQRAGRASYEPPLTRQTGRIDFRQGAGQIVNLARGLDPQPGAYAQMTDGALKIWKARRFDGALTGGGTPGEILVSDARRGLIVACGKTGNEAVELIEIQASNARRMSAKAYLTGKAIEVGRIFNG